MDQDLSKIKSSKVNDMFRRKCIECKKEVINNRLNLSWEAMEFCDSRCLLKYQERIEKHCPTCSIVVESVGMYIMRIGFDLRQFCGYNCFLQRRGNLKMCSYCQKNIEGRMCCFSKPRDDIRKCKEFCGRQCLQKFHDIVMKTERKTKGICAGCGINKIKLESDYLNEINVFCGDTCLNTYFSKKNFATGKCEMCEELCNNQVRAENSNFFNNKQHNFCSKICQNIYIIINRKFVECSLCKTKKYNFEMILFTFRQYPLLMLCSLRCLNLFQKSLHVDCRKEVKCDNCHKILHCSVSPGTGTFNFCSSICITAFQSQALKLEIEGPDISGNEKKVAESANDGSFNAQLVDPNRFSTTVLDSRVAHFKTSFATNDNGDRVNMDNYVTNPEAGDIWQKIRSELNVQLINTPSSTSTVSSSSEIEGITNNVFPHAETDDATDVLQTILDELQAQLSNTPVSASTASSGL